MKTDQRNLAVSHLWLFSAGIDPATTDVDGEPLAQSLASLVQKRFEEGRAEAAKAFLKLRESGTFPRSAADQTGNYDLGQLEELLEQVTGVIEPTPILSGGSR